jgi:hypothetical protein
MHIHENTVAVNGASFYSAVQGQSSAAALRAAEVRKKLLRGASEMRSVATPDEALLMGRWLDVKHRQIPDEDEYHPSSSDSDSIFG